MAFVAVRCPATEGTMGVPRARERQVGVWPVLSRAGLTVAVLLCLAAC